MHHVVKMQRLSSSANNLSVGSSEDRESEEPVSTTSLTDSSTTASVIAAQTGTSIIQGGTVSTSSSSAEPARKTARVDWKPTWKERYLVDFDRSSQEMICMVCHIRMRCVRSDTITKHFNRMHKDIKSYSLTEKRKVQLSYMRHRNDIEKSRQKLRHYFDPAKLAALAPNKLAYVIAQHKKPFSDCDMCIEFALAADPHSEVFSDMASSRRTVVHRMNDIFSYMQDERKEEIQKAMFLSVMADESMDTSVCEQLILYLRYIDIESEEIVTRFAGIRKIEGHPTAENLFLAADCILSELQVPKEFIACSTVDGASAMFSARQSAI